MAVSIRDAALEDASDMVEIFNESVDEGAQSWDKHWKLEEAVKWLSELQKHGFPVSTSSNDSCDQT